MSLLLRMGGVDPTSERGRAIAADLGRRDPCPETRRLLVQIATRYIVAGGVWLPGTWADLLDVERAACVEAGEQLSAARTLQAAQASASPRGFAEVASTVDGGQCLARLEEEATDAALAELRASTRAALRPERGPN